MMISIGITVCDKDYKCLDSLLEQIEKKVTVEHEVIIIDNREKYLDEKTSWKATYSFGYNACQFSARAKIIEYAKGDYIWFIDGDDDIAEVKDFNYTEDIIAFAYNNYPNGNCYLGNCEKKGKLLDYETINVIRPVLWNKFIKRSLFSKEFIEKYSSLKIVHCEDTIWLYEALAHAETLRQVDYIIYYHKEGLSNRVGKITCKELHSLTTGFNDAQKIIREYFEEDVADRILRDTYTYLSSFVPKTDNIVEATNLIMDLIPKESFKDILQTSIYIKCQNTKQLETVIETVAKRYGEKYPYKEITCKVTFEDGHIEDYTFVQRIDFEENKKTVLEGQWNHNISIICLVYEGNVKYLADFTSQIKDNVNIQHEVIIVDNRKDKSSPLNYIGDATVIEAEGNVGILEGRRLGFEASHNEYIWFTDIDDYILPVSNVDYGDNDILAFPFFWKGEQRNLGKRIIPETEFYTYDIMYTLNVLLWNKWFKRSILEQAYKDIPHFFCIYNEDNIVFYTALKYAKYIETFDGEPIYTHLVNDDSTTTKQIKDEKSVDILFAGYEEVTEYMKTNFDFCKEISYLSPYNIMFYLDIMEQADDSILEYFADKLICLFGITRVQEAVEIGRKENRYNRIKNYFITD